MHVRIINNQPVWPYGPATLRADEPNTSFPEVISPELLAEYQVFQLTVDEPPTTTYLQDAVAQEPVLENGDWVQHWLVVDASQETIDERYNTQVALVRQDRNGRLAECDWTQAKDIPDSISSAWQPYRQQLRDVPDQPGFPFEVEWPIQPE